MLARLQRFIVAALVLSAAVWAAWFLAAGALTVAIIGVLVLLSGHALVLGLEVVLMASVNRRHHEPPATPRQLLRAWWTESWTAPLVFCWRQPFRSHTIPDAPDAPGQRGVVLVHGFVCNRGIWNPWMRRLRSLGIPFVAVDLEPVFGSIDGYAAIVEQAVRRIEKGTGTAPVVVGHSMGGLAIRAWLDAYAADARVHRVVTIGSPHAGTWLGALAHSHNTRQMARGGPWLNDLRLREPAQRLARFTCFWGHCDNIVFPASTATLPGADNRHLPGCPHVAMAYQPEVLTETLRWLRGTAPERSMAAA